MTSSQPILAGFYPDPSICRVGDTYVLISSSFEYLPGIPVHTSTDLVEWTFVGNALTRPAQIRENEGHPSSGIFAATIRHHDGQFWIIGTNVNEIPEGRGHFLIHAESPEGPWSDPVHIAGAIGIDPDIVWDDEGTAYVSWCSLNPAQPGILGVGIDTRTGAMLDAPRPLWQGTGLQAPEGPHLYRIEDWWYLLLAEGGTERGHAATIARARTLDGPFEPAPLNPFLTHRSLAHPVQNVGHADLVEREDGTWAAVHLGVRPRGQSPGFHTNGRETFLVGIDWIDGWPVVDDSRFEVRQADTSFDERFSSEHLHGRWLSVGQFPSSISWKNDDGIFVIDAVGESHAMIVARATETAWTATAEISPHGGAGRFLIRIDDNHWYGLTFDGSTVEAHRTIGGMVQSLGVWRVPADGNPTLQISVKPARPHPFGLLTEPDLVELAVLTPDGAHSFGDLDGRYLSTEVAGGFTGRTFGVQALEGPVYVKRITYTPTPEAPGVD